MEDKTMLTIFADMQNTTLCNLLVSKKWICVNAIRGWLPVPLADLRLVP